MTQRFTSIDLFCGCGGFTLGLRRAGFRALAAIDCDPHAVAVFRANLPEVPLVLERDLTRFPPSEFAVLFGTRRVDLIVGGPPCQGFSTVRRRDGSNYGPCPIEDPRRELYRPFLDYVRYFRPAVFVMENVPGVRTADGGRHFAAICEESGALGYSICDEIIRAEEFGVPQKRRRRIIVGTRRDLPVFDPNLVASTHTHDDLVTLGEAVGDLPPRSAGMGEGEEEYDMECRRRHIKKYGRRYLFGVLEIRKARKLTAHRARPHSARDLRDFARLREGENSHQAMQRGERFEYPYDKTVFHDRYTRQHRDRLCSTIVAHLSKDGLMFVHPTQNRSLTPREAARVQSFPDWFSFPVARTSQFRLIGNAVPPLVAKAMGRAVFAYLQQAAKLQRAQPPQDKGKKHVA